MREFLILASACFVASAFAVGLGWVIALPHVRAAVAAGVKDAVPLLK